MLKIKEPIHIRQAIMPKSGAEAFSNKILGNYEMFSAGFSAEKLIYLIRGEEEQEMTPSITTLVANEYIDQNITANMNLINQFLNRITLINTEKFSYQDNIFISRFLNKLGISDEKIFLKRLKQYLQETDYITDIANIYIDNKEKFNLLFQVLEEQKNTYNSNLYDDSVRSIDNKNIVQTEEKKISKASYSQNWYQYMDAVFAENIFKKYSIEENRKLVKSYNNISADVTDITLSLRQKTEQYGDTIQAFYKNSSLMKINNDMQNVLVGQHIADVALVHSNPYELNRYIYNEENIKHQLLSALLFNLSDSFYKVTKEIREENKYAGDKWYFAEVKLPELVSDTVKRFVENHTFGRQNNIYMEQDGDTENIRKKQLSLMEALAEEMEKSVSDVVNTENSIIHNSIRTDYLNKETENIYDNYTTEDSTSDISKVDNIYIKNHLENVLEMIYQDKGEEKDEKHNEIVTVDRIYENNENYKSTTIIENNIEKSGDIQYRLDVRQTRKDALKALENPEEIIEKYINGENTISSQKQQQYMETLEELPEDSRRILDTVARYLENPEEAVRNGLVAENPELLLKRDIEEIEEIATASAGEMTDAGENEENYFRQEVNERDTHKKGIKQLSENEKTVLREIAEYIHSEKFWRSEDTKKAVLMWMKTQNINKTDSWIMRSVAEYISHRQNNIWNVNNPDISETAAGIEKEKYMQIKRLVDSETFVDILEKLQQGTQEKNIRGNVWIDNEQFYNMAAKPVAIQMTKHIEQYISSRGGDIILDIIAENKSITENIYTENNVQEEEKLLFSNIFETALSQYETSENTNETDIYTTEKNTSAYSIVKEYMQQIVNIENRQEREIKQLSEKEKLVLREVIEHIHSEKFWENKETEKTVLMWMQTQPVSKTVSWIMKSVVEPAINAEKNISLNISSIDKSQSEENIISYLLNNMEEYDEEHKYIISENEMEYLTSLITGYENTAVAVVNGISNQYFVNIRGKEQPELIYDVRERDGIQDNTEEIRERTEIRSGETEYSYTLNENINSETIYNSQIQDISNTVNAAVSANQMEIKQVKNEFAGLQQNVEKILERQISEITEKVYTKLEKRMQSERRRRGY